MTADENEKSVSQLFKKHKSNLAYTMPKGLRDEVMREFSSSKESAVSGESSLKDSEQRSVFAWLSFGGGTFAAAVALVLAFQFGKMSSGGAGSDFLTEEVISSHVRSLMVNHLSDVISTDQHTVKPWFAGKLDFGPNVKDFAKDGFPLIGGRLDYIDGRQAAALVFKSNQHVINVFEFPVPSQQDSKPRLKSIRGYQVFNWVKDGMNYSVVSDVNAADLQRFVGLWE